MYTKLLLLAAVLSVPVLALASDQPAAPSGPVVGTVAPRDNMGGPVPLAPKNIMVNIDGRQRSLASLFKDATLLVFPRLPCMPSESEVVRAGASVGQAVSIIEISGPSEGCQAQQECALARGAAARGIIALCDAEGWVRDYYSVYGPNAVVLLDRDGFVLDYGSIDDDFVRLEADACALAALAEPGQ
jgi:hypothetical protein